MHRFFTWLMYNPSPFGSLSGLASKPIGSTNEALDNGWLWSSRVQKLQQACGATLRPPKATWLLLVGLSPKAGGNRKKGIIWKLLPCFCIARTKIICFTSRALVFISPNERFVVERTTFLRNSSSISPNSAKSRNPLEWVGTHRWKGIPTTAKRSRTYVNNNDVFVS